MKQNKLTGNKSLSLKKTTIARLQTSQLNNIKAAAGTTITDGVAETCGYVCGDCISITVRTIKANTL